MPTFDQYIGRREAVGIGIGAVQATAVAPQIWIRWLENSLQTKTDVIENDSALGIVEEINDSAVVGKWVEGTLGGKITDVGFGFVLLGMFGSVSTGAQSGGKYPHTFNVNQSAKPPAMTLATSGPDGGYRRPYLTFDSLEISAEKQAWAQFSSVVKARVGATSTETVAFSDEVEFTSKNITLKTAANIAGLAAATAIDALSVKINIERESAPHWPLGGDDNPDFDRGALKATGEMVIRYMDTQIEADQLANTIKAMSLTMANGTTSLAFTGGQVRFREIDKTRDKNAVVTQTVSFAFEVDPATSRKIQAVLNNSRVSYIAA